LFAIVGTAGSRPDSAGGSTIDRDHARGRRGANIFLLTTIAGKNSISKINKVLRITQN
jgi:hypothetical protein